MKLGISNIISSTVRSEHELGGAKLTLKVSPRARRMRLHVDPRTRSVVLTMPKRLSQRRALAWAAGHQLWVEQAAGDVGRVECAGLVVLELVQAAFAAAVAQRLPFLAVERRDRLFPEFVPHRTHRPSSVATPSGP